MNYFKDNNNKIFAFDDKQVKQGYGKDLTAITQAEFDAMMQPTLVEVQASKISEINTLCDKAITGGFTSSALGAVHTYQSEQIDQLNLIGVVIAGADSMFKCGVVNADKTITWNYVMHTIAQLKQVLVDGKEHKLALLQKANTLKVQVAEATTVEEIEVIVWQ